MTQADLCETQVAGPTTREIIVVARAGSPLLEHRIVSIGVSHAGPGFEFVRRRPRFASVLACLHGAGRVLVDGEWRACGPGQAYVLPAKAMHAYQAVGRWTVGWIHYGRGPGTLALEPFTPPWMVRFDQGAFRACLLELLREQRGPADAPMLRLWAGLVHRHLERMVHGPARDRRLDGLWAKVERDIAREWTTADLAGELGVGQERLRQLSVAAAGRSPMRHLAHLRMTRAAHLLRTTREPVAAIADVVGYGDAFVFSSAFRRWAGMSPRAYRMVED